MQLTTILNRVEYFKSFVYGKAKWVENAAQPTIEVQIEARKNGRPICSGCGHPAPGYDRLPQRRFEYVPFWGITIYFIYAMRRVECPTCGVRVEKVPWCDGKNQLTTTYRWFLAGWAKRLSWKEVASVFGTSWQKRVSLGKTRSFVGIGASRPGRTSEAIGVDEIQWQRVATSTDAGVPDRRRLSSFAMGRQRPHGEDAFAFLPHVGQRPRLAWDFVSSDMWKPYLKVIAKKAPQAIHVLDRFHIMAK